MRVISVFIILIFVFLPDVVRRVADDDADLTTILTFNPIDIFISERTEKIELVARMNA